MIFRSGYTGGISRRNYMLVGLNDNLRRGLPRGSPRPSLLLAAIAVDQVRNDASIRADDVVCGVAGVPAKLAVRLEPVGLPRVQIVVVVHIGAVQRDPVVVELIGAAVVDSGRPAAVGVHVCAILGSLGRLRGGLARTEEASGEKRRSKDEVSMHGSLRKLLVPVRWGYRNDTAILAL